MKIKTVVLALLTAGCSKFDGTTSPLPQDNFSDKGKITVEVRKESTPLTDVTVKLSGLESHQSQTGVNGQTVFDDLGVGDYAVSIEGFADNIVFPQTSQAVALYAGGDVWVRFVGWSVPNVSWPVPGSITVQVKKNSIPLTGVTVSLAGLESRIGYTGADGRSVFSILAEGGYTVSIDNFPSDVVFPLVSQNVELVEGGTVVVNFVGWAVSAPPEPIPPLPPDQKATISGIVYEDANGNGRYDNGEPLFSGLGVGLSGTEHRSTFTASNGRYVFPVLYKGNYDVIIVNPNPNVYRFDFEQNLSVSANVAIDDDHGTIFFVDFRAVRK
ncbi:MAG: hypothetical protein HYT38_00325 [Candidatus Sungbacteria bacterium]|uniref:SD-repeat containing protein B domain-containing protein n=1 Tax=Candidatus Sungiibacteriota bacterium TaxID=2750080 RepID=A0A9D6DRG2_9BACT|nr:hypothetical protein [Candidatus Sungbacteria bacterium]